MLKTSSRKQIQQSRHRKAIKRRLVQLYPYLIIILFAIILLLPEILHQSYTGGLDSYFHINAFYEAAMQIKHNTYSYFISLFGFDQSGRVVNALYAPGFSYLMGELLLICKTWVTFSIVSAILVLSISGIGLYIVAHYCHIRTSYAVILSLLYMMSHPVMSWVGDQEFTGVGAMLLPFVFLVGLKIARNHKIKIIPLVVLMSVLLQTHLLTSLTAIFVLIPYTLYGFIKSLNKKRMFEKGILSVIITFFLNGNVFGALYELFTSNYLIPTFPQFTTQANGVKFYDLSFTNVGITFTIVTAISAATMILAMFKFSKIDFITLFIGALFLWISSYYFPWSSIERRWIHVTNMIQFPQRFMAVFWIAALLCIGIVTTKVSEVHGIRQVFGKNISLMILMFLLVITFGATLDYIGWLPNVWNSNKVVRYMTSDKYFTNNPDTIRSAFRSHNLKKGLNVVKKQTPDYLPSTRDINLKKYYKLPIYSEMDSQLQNSKFKCHKSVAPHRLILNWHSKVDKRVTIPAVKYHNSKVSLNGQRIKPDTTFVGAIRINERVGKNRVVINYKPSTLFKVLAVLMIISWIILTSLGIKGLVYRNS